MVFTHPKVTNKRFEFLPLRLFESKNIASAEIEDLTGRVLQTRCQSTNLIVKAGQDYSEQLKKIIHCNISLYVMFIDPGDTVIRHTPTH